MLVASAASRLFGRRRAATVAGVQRGRRLSWWIQQAGLPFDLLLAIEQETAADHDAVAHLEAGEHGEVPNCPAGGILPFGSRSEPNFDKFVVAFPSLPVDDLA